MTDDRLPPEPELQDLDDGGAARGRLWIERLFRDNHLEVLAYARRRIGLEADDIVSEVFATAWQRRADVPDDALPWLYRTAANHILHARRAWAHQVRTSQELAAAEALPRSESDFTALIGEEDLLVQALRQLSERDQEILRLWAWEQLELSRISDTLGCSSATARVQLHRARRRLRARLDAMQPERTPAPRILRTTSTTTSTPKECT